MRPINPSTNSLSPPSLASPVHVANHGPSVPVPRANNHNNGNHATWDKPERARTSHACEPCRERKTKCDGSRPACRRCLHTGTTCYYGYGKGWRKRKTAEDLTATSRRLARYETLLNQIFPLVSPEVRALIEDARENEGSNASNTSETTENDYGVPPTRLESGLVGPGGRIILPLPVPSPHIPAVSRSSTSSGTYEAVPVPSVGPPPALPNGSSTSSMPTSQRLSPDANSLTRLPSITSGGILLEAGRPDQSPPPLAQGPGSLESASIYGQDRLGALPTSPSGPPSLGETTRLPKFSPG